MGFHALDWVIILVVALAIFGPRALQSVARNAGKTMGQAKTMKDKVISELPIEELSEVSREIPRIPMSPHQAIPGRVASLQSPLLFHLVWLFRCWSGSFLHTAG